MMNSGMSSSEIRTLTLKDYLDSHKIRKYDLFNFEETIKKLQEKEIPTWTIRRIKTRMPYITFSSPEANKAINDYLEDRNEKRPITDIDDYLFLSVNHKIKPVIFTHYFTLLAKFCIPSFLSFCKVLFPVEVCLSSLKHQV